MDEQEGVVQLGEVTIISRKDSPSDMDHAEAYRSGARDAYQAVDDWAVTKQELVGPYEDTGTLAELRLFLADIIREVYSGSAEGDGQPQA